MQEQDERQKQLREKARRLIEDARRGRAGSLTESSEAASAFDSDATASGGETSLDTSSIGAEELDQLSLNSLDSEPSSSEGGDRISPGISISHF